MNDILKKINKKNRLYRMLLLLISLLLGAIIYNIFLLKLNIVTGGVSGVGTVLKHLYGVEPAVIVLILSLICCALGFIFLGAETTIATVIASVLYSSFIKLTAPLANIITISNEDILVTMIFAGILSGISSGLMYKSGYPNGGFPVIYQILNKKFGIAISKSSLVVNIIIVFVGGLYFGSINAMYAIIYLYISSLIIDKVLLGISNNKAFYIITSEEREVRKYIIDELHHNVTIFDVKGGFLEKKRKVLLSVIPSREYYKVTEALKRIDKEAFFVVTDSYEVIGGK